ncbi:transposase [Mesorhizobium muleiense]|uniref:transposase n=1 Tax=Mesorhizobium muleiense TaxID=1004279 RepID=UPI0039AF81B2
MWSLADRGLRGVKLIIADGQKGLARRSSPGLQRARHQTCARPSRAGSMPRIRCAISSSLASSAEASRGLMYVVKCALLRP